MWQQNSKARKSRAPARLYRREGMVTEPRQFSAFELPQGSNLIEATECRRQSVRDNAIGRHLNIALQCKSLGANAYAAGARRRSYRHTAIQGKAQRRRRRRLDRQMLRLLRLRSATTVMR